MVNPLFCYYRTAPWEAAQILYLESHLRPAQRPANEAVLCKENIAQD